MRTTEINQYLDSLGCDFAVCFLPVEETILFDQPLDKSYLQQIEEMITGDEQVDLVFSANIYRGVDDCSDSYHRIVEDRLFISLDDYLNNTESGKKLYNLMPEKHWEGLKVSGHIYGVDGSMNTLSYYSGYSIDRAVANEYGYDVTVSPLEQLDILAEIAKEHTVCFSNPFNLPEIYAPMYPITSVVYWDNSESKAKSVLESGEFLQTLEIYYTLVKNGFVSKWNDSSPFIYFEGNRNGCISVLKGDRYCQFDSTIYIRPTWSVTGISANSKHPDKAFELLALAQTDPVLNNLLAYGVEGENYTLSDGKVINKGRLITRLNTFANRLICLPDDKSPDNASEVFRKTLEEAELVSCNGFWFDEKETFEIVEKTNNFFINWEFDECINNGEYESFEAMIQACRDKLDEYGMEDLLSEINRQYEEWAKENENN